MEGWTQQELALYRELERRAQEQARDFYARRKGDTVQEPHEAERVTPPPQARPSLPPACPEVAPAVCQASQPGPSSRGGASQAAPGRGWDREAVLLGLLLYVMLRERAGKELVLALAYILLF